LPDELKGHDTQRTEAQALVQYARATRKLGDLDAAWKASSEAISILEGLRKAGDDSEATVVTQARALDVQALIRENSRRTGPLATSKQSLDVLALYSKRPDASAAVRETEIDLLNTYGYMLANASDVAAIEPLQRSLRLATELGAREGKDTYVSGLFVDASAWMVAALLLDGRFEEAKAVGMEGSAVADKVLAQRPGDRTALYALALIQQILGDGAVSELRPQEAVPFLLRAAAVQQTLVDFDTGNKIAQNNLTGIRWSLAELYWTLGEVDNSLETLDDALVTAELAGQGGPALRMSQLNLMGVAVRKNADTGNLGKARALANEMTPIVSALRTSEPAGSLAPSYAEIFQLGADMRIADAGADARATLALCTQMDSRLQKLRPEGVYDDRWKKSLLYLANEQKARSEIELKDFAAADRSAQAALQAKEAWIIDPSTDRRMKASVATLQALALALQDRKAEARQVIEPVVKLHRDLSTRNHGDLQQRVEMAGALYTQALADPAHRTALLRESQALLASLPGPVKSLKSTRFWFDRVRQDMS
jgi:hypothetical protein